MFSICFARFWTFGARDNASLLHESADMSVERAFLFLHVPCGEGVQREMTIVVASDASHFLSEPCWLVERGVRGG